VVECIEKVLGLVARLNFGIKQFYNVIILGPVTKVMEVEQWFKQNLGGKNEVGFYAWDTTAGIQPGKQNVFIEHSRLKEMWPIS
jgi:hypothetical protein